jgi:aspartyl-tRNA(Asn)/glutamyl-tRNA(Gln) amidotransferase subunit B
MEIVSEPELESPEETVAYLNSLRQILVYSGVSDADMEKGQMRCDVNISVRPKGQTELGTKIELKNLNSVSAVRRAIHYEIGRQIDEVGAGRPIRQATWRWNDEVGQTELMRLKEDAHDYRYFPDPDLLPVRTAAFLARVREHLPELPHEKVARFESAYQITHYDASVLASDRALADWYEAAASGSGAPKKVANWVINNLLSELNGRGLAIGECPVTPAALAELVDLVESGKVSNNQGKEVFAHLFDHPSESPAAIARAKGFEPADSGEIEGIVDEVIAANPGPVGEIKTGNDKAANFLVGQVMKLSKGKANPKQVTEMVLARIRG